MTPASHVRSVATLAVFLAAPVFARADPPPPPKVCVIVAGDPDDAARSAARGVERSLMGRSDVRTLSDEAVRAALRGEPTTDSGLADLVSQRRSLRVDDTDGLTLDGLGHRLGCALATEIAARPEGVFVRSYDVLHHGFVDAGATYPSIGGSRAAAIARDAQRAVSGTLQLGWGIAANARLAIVPPAAHGPTASAAPTSQATHPAPTTQRPPLVGWIVAGGAALALIGGFLIAQSVGPASPVITVSHGASAGASP